MTTSNLFVTGYMCIPSEDKGTSSSFDGFNCSETINCTDVKHKPVCGSDGVTYDSMCHLNQEYQRNVCEYVFTLVCYP